MPVELYRHMRTHIMHHRHLSPGPWLALSLAMGLTLGCASAAPAPRAGTSTIAGTLNMVPREGVEPGHAGGAYGSRSMRDVRFVDYERPGFAVVHADRPAPIGDRTEIHIIDGRRGPFFDPATAAVALGGTIRIHNDGARAQVLSSPDAGLLRSVAPGEVIEVSPEHAGPHRIFLLENERDRALVFVAPGAYAVASPHGSYELRELAPGTVTLQAWHPRFPAESRAVDAAAGQRVEVDLAISVQAQGALSHEGH